MKTFLVSFILLISLFLFAQNIFAQPQIIDVALCQEIKSRQPNNFFSTPGYCKNEQNSTQAIPIIDSKIHKRIYFWNRVSSSHTTTLLHTWYKDGLKMKAKRTETHWIDKALHIIEDIKVGLGLKKMATVELRIKPSGGFRTWSSKEIDPYVHVGKWEVRVSTTTDPANVLCSSEFEIK